VEELKTQLEYNKREAHQAEEQYKEAMHHWQTKVFALFSKIITEKKKILDEINNYLLHT